MKDYSIQIVKQLSQGFFISGNTLAQQFNISRTRVWQLIQQLKQSGLNIHSVMGKGYKLVDKIELLNSDVIAKYLKKPKPEIIIFTHINSTNQYLIKNHKKHNTPCVVIAEAQSAGRGRRGKTWLNSFGGSLALSFFHQIQLPSSKLSGLSLVTGLAINKALNELGVKTQLKWPNDIYIGNKKLGGILIDIVGSNTKQTKVVTGIGLNIQIPNAIKSQIEQPITDLNTVNKQLKQQRNQISALIIKQINSYYLKFEKQGFDAFIEQWNEADLLKNKKIKIDQHNELSEGIAQGVTNNGALKVKIKNQTHTLYSGEVSLKLA